MTRTKNSEVTFVRINTEKGAEVITPKKNLVSLKEMAKSGNLSVTVTDSGSILISVDK